MLDVSEQGDEREELEIIVGRMVRKVSPMERKKKFLKTHTAFYWRKRNIYRGR